MKPYSRNSLYRFAPLRRARYGRGHGVHSPRAFALIQQLVRPRGSYYAFEDTTTLFRSPAMKLVYRALARLNPEIVLLHTSDPDIQSAVDLAGGRIQRGAEHSADRLALIITEDCAEVKVEQTKLFLVLNIRKNREREADFKQLSQQLSEGLIIDLFDHAIIAFVPNVRYLYRSSL